MILLTGAAGFIGSNVLAALNAQGRDDIICVDDLTNGAKCQNLAGKKFHRYYDYRGDGDPEAVFKLHEITQVVHLGANTDTRCADGRAIVNDNYAYSVRLLEKLEACRWENSSMVYASSAAVYGSDARNGTSFRELPEDENPRSPYAVSKWMFDMFARRWLEDTEFAEYPPSLTGLRFFNVYGPGEHHKGRMRSVIGTMLNDINAGKRPTLFEGSPWIYRDFVWIGDVVKTVLWAMSSAQPCGIFNVGTGQARTFMDVFQAVAHETEYDGGPQYVDFPRDLPHYQHFTQANLDRLRAAGFADTFTPLEQGVNLYARSQLL